MKRSNDDSKACRDADAVKAPDRSVSDVGWMTNAGVDDCKLTAARAPLWALVEALRILSQKQNAKTRSKIVAGAMKRRFGVVAGSDESLRKGVKASHV